MSFDCSRFTFNPLNDYLGVVMQQGRVQLDSDWNEWQAQFARRIQAGTLDIVGRAAYPIKITPDAFRITPSSDNGALTVTIGPGRMYVDGLLAENHGTVPPAFTVVAAGSPSNQSNYTVQITSNGGTFSLVLSQNVGGVSQSVGTALSGLTLSNLLNSINSSDLTNYIQIVDVAQMGLPATGQYALSFVGSVFAVTIPSAATLNWDPALAEMSGVSEAPSTSPPAEMAIDYFQQPYYPGAFLPPGTGSPADNRLLFYLDVWQRAVTSLEDLNLIDKAVGVDTTGRIQTVWQVKTLALNGSPGSVDYSNSSGQLPPELQDLLLPPGSLSTGVVQSPTSGPCCLTPNTSYTGLENQLYRVEIHSPGQPLSVSSTPITTVPQGTATFKWSRDNASVATAVLAIDNTGKRLTVVSTGKDDVLCFSPGDWIEITDDWLELNGIQGELFQIVAGGVANNVITLESPVQATILPDGLTTTLDPTQPLDPARHTRIRRWDQGDPSSQNGQVFLGDGKTLWVDLSDATNPNAIVQNAPAGEIPVPPPGTTLILENGITVSFDWDSNNIPFNYGDFWTFAARTADGSVEILNNAPPQGIHHHYAALAVVSFPNTATDIRVPWPPEFGGGGCCSISLQPEDLERDGLALQRACDSLANSPAGANGAAICLAPGTYPLGQTLRLNANHAGLTIEGCHGGATLQADSNSNPTNFSDGLVVIEGNNVTLDGLGIQCAAAPLSTAFGAVPVWWMIGLRIQGCDGVTIRNCALNSPSNPPSNTITMAAGILASGNCSGFTIEDNQFSGPFPAQVSFGFIMTAIAGLAALGNAEFRHNQFQGLSVALFSTAVTGAIGIRENTVSGCFGGFWLSNSDLSASLKEAAASDATFQNIANALALMQPRQVPLILLRMTPQFQVVDNQMTVGPALLAFQKPSSGWAVLISAGSAANSSLVLNANDLRASWYNNVVLISGVAYSSITSNVIVNLLMSAPPDSTGKVPLSLGVFPDGTATAVAGNVLFGRSNLGPGFTPRADIQAFDANAIQQIPALAQLNTWKFLNYEPTPPRFIRDLTQPSS